MYSEVQDEGQETITVKWVITEKDDGNVKSRLVAHGFKEQTDDICKDSPTCSRGTANFTLTCFWKRLENTAH